MKTPEQLRSHRWFGDNRADSVRAFSHRSRMRGLGVTAEEHEGKPIIAILNTWSGINPCHQHLRERAEQVRRGVLQAGGFPVEMPVATLSETFQKPTPMMYRNLLSMETEELLRSYPFDGAVLMGGCDKTTPALIMGAASANVPAIFVPAGPMLSGNYRGQKVGSGTDMWRVWDDYRAGAATDCDLQDLEEGIARSPGHCMTMGTASTMTSAAEALGMTLPGAASIPAVDSAHYRMAVTTGQAHRRHGLGRHDARHVLTREAFEDAAATVFALGGSTNALIHLIAMAGRAGVALTLDDFDAISRRVPWLANIRPGGEYLMEDFYYAGGLPALLAQLAKVPGALHRRPTVTGRTLRQYLMPRRLQRRRDPHPGHRAGGRGRHRRAARQPGPGRRGDQAHRRRAAAAQAHRPRRRLRRLRDLQRAHQRPGAQHHTRLGPGAAQRRSDRRPGMPEYGQLPIPATCSPRHHATWYASPTRG